MSHIHHTSHMSPHHMGNMSHMSPVHHMPMFDKEDSTHYITIGFVVLSIIIGIIAVLLGGLAAAGYISFKNDSIPGKSLKKDNVSFGNIKGLDLELTEDATVAGTLGVTGATTLTGALASNGDVTLGDAQADKVLINGKLVRGNITRTDVDTETATITAAQFLGGLIVHTTTGTTGTVTMDTAANLISTLELENDGEIATCYYVNDGGQTATITGSSTGVTYITNNIDVITQTSTIIVVLRTGSAAVSVFTV